MPLTKGEYTYGTPELQGDMNTVTIGKYCSIAPGVKIDSGWNHNMNAITTFPFHSLPYAGSPNTNICKGDVVIGHDCWIGQEAVIMSGVTIGHGSIIGLRSIITKDVAPYSVVVGNNRLVRRRFSDMEIEKLLTMAWWDWPHGEVILAVGLLNSRDVSGLWQFWKDRKI